MPSVITSRETPAAAPPLKKWTRAECELLEATGLLEQQHLELIEGDLIRKMGKKRPHVNVLTLLQHWLTTTYGFEFVNTEAPIDVAPEDNPTNEPEPDLIVLARPSREFASNPRPVDLRLVVEVSDSTLGFDLRTKAALYARAQILEYWVVDLSSKRLMVHREPQAGAYQSVTAFSNAESVRPLSAPDRELLLSEIFG